MCIYLNSIRLKFSNKSVLINKVEAKNLQFLWDFSQLLRGNPLPVFQIIALTSSICSWIPRRDVRPLEPEEGRD